jgi:hypothetical protein
MKSAIGWYKGIEWRSHRLNQIFPDLDYRGNWKGRTRYYFPYECHKPSGDHFTTLVEMFAWIDEALETGWIRK